MSNETLNAVTYQSLLSHQQEKMKESEIFVFDLSKETNISCLDPYFVLLYIIGELPVVPGMIVEAASHIVGRRVSFKPAKMQRDDHLVICKYPPEYFSYKVQIIKTIASDLSDEKFVKIAELMKQRISTITKVKKKNHKKIKHFKRIKEINLTSSSKLSMETKIEILNLWFSDAITGPICITRSLAVMEFPDELTSDVLMNETTKKIKDVVGIHNFWQFKFNHLMLVDQHFFLISGQESFDMDFPIDIGISYVGLRESGQKLQNIKETIEKIGDKKYLKTYKETDDVAFYTEIVKNESGQFRLKLEYGKSVFCGVQQELIKMINSDRFYTWCKTTQGVKWEIWFGRDEQDKLTDYRKLTRINLELQQQIAVLEQQLSAKINLNDSIEH